MMTEQILAVLFVVLFLKRCLCIPAKNSCIIFTFVLGFVYSAYKILSSSIDVFYCLFLVLLLL